MGGQFMDKLIAAIRQGLNMPAGTSDFVIIAMFVVGCLLVVASVVALVISIFLAISYVRYNRKQNSLGKTGEEIAREVLDKNGLDNIKVSKNGSILFGNSYSHYFKKVRLRRLTWKKTSVSSLAMATQKSSLAVMDKEGDPAMKLQIRLTPFIYFGPLAFIPLVVIGFLIDWFLLNSTTYILTFSLTGVGLAFYILSFIFSILVLKTEKKAQQKALELMEKDNLANEEEREMCKKLFHLYNIEYINNMVIALLEAIYRVLQIVGYAQGASSASSSD